MISCHPGDVPGAVAHAQRQAHRRCRWAGLQLRPALIAAAPPQALAAIHTRAALKRLPSGGFGHLHFTTGAHGRSQSLQHRHSGLPDDAAIGDALPVAQRLALHQFLTATAQMALDHHTDAALFAVFQLNGDVLDHLRLVVRVLQAVGVAGIDHQAGRQLGLGQRLAGLGNAACVVVRLLAAAQDHMAVRIAGGRDDGGAALLGDRQEMMRIGGSPHRVSSDLDVAIGAVLEADRARQPRGQPPGRRCTAARSHRGIRHRPAGQAC
ncbi:hypothetical protein G6F40_013611 [Rhizopus arrhizus]|nr:hypothetical protein G6F40_013611 [Rhizopus arrhizus]